MMSTSSRRSRTGPLLLVASLVVIACGPSDGQRSGEPVDLAVEWTVVPPGSVDVDANGLGRALESASAIVGLESVAVVRHGRLVGEWYLGSTSADTLRSIRSVTKSVLSLLVGLAIERGIFQGTSERLADLFHPPLPVLQGMQTEITLQHLLTMTSGFDWDETPDQFDAWTQAPDPIDYILQRPITPPPGSFWNYDSAAVHLLSAALTSASGAGTDVFADQVLFGPLGISQRRWVADDRGIPFGAAGLSLRTRDLAKLGQLVLQQGRSGSVQVVPADWVQTSTMLRLQTPTGLATTGALRYGYLWWVGKLSGRGLILAWGFGGQFIAIVLELDLVVVTTADWQGLGSGARAQEDGIIRWIGDSILPTAR
jgi:CubicO group peptidase (beta-lactamase class C family)